MAPLAAVLLFLPLAGLGIGLLLAGLGWGFQVLGTWELAWQGARILSETGCWNAEVRAGVERRARQLGIDPARVQVLSRGPGFDGTAVPYGEKGTPFEIRHDIPDPVPGLLRSLFGEEGGEEAAVRSVYARTSWTSFRIPPLAEATLTALSPEAQPCESLEAPSLPSFQGAEDLWTSGLARHYFVKWSDGTVWALSQFGESGGKTAGLAESGPGPQDASFVWGAGTIIRPGLENSIGLRPDGTVWSSGSTEHGLGTGEEWPRQNYQAPPVQAALPAKAVSVWANYWSFFAVDLEGFLWAWGRDYLYGQLCLGSGTYSVLAPANTGIRGVRKVTGGVDFTIGLKSDGTVFGCGSNLSAKELGIQDDGWFRTPVHPQLPSPAVDVSSGRLHTLALLADGTVWAWGGNSYGQLGDGTRTDFRLPGQVPGLGSVIAIAAGSQHSLALRSDGTVWAWGRNDYGQLGDGTYAHREAPVQTLLPMPARKIGAGTDFSLAILQDGTVWGWGRISAEPGKPALPTSTPKKLLFFP